MKNPRSLPQVYSLSEPLYGWSVGFDFPVSQIFFMTLEILIGSTIEAMMVLVGLGVYLGMVRSFTLRRFLRGSLIAMSIIVPGNTLSVFLVELRSPGYVALAVGLISLFLGLLLSASVARQSIESGKATVV